LCGTLQDRPECLRFAPTPSKLGPPVLVLFQLAVGDTVTQD